MEESRRLYFYMCYKPTMISPSCIFLSSFVSTCRFVCIVPSEVIAQLAVSRPKFLFKSHPGVPTCINKYWNWLAYSLWLWELVINKDIWTSLQKIIPHSSKFQTVVFSLPNMPCFAILGLMPLLHQYHIIEIRFSPLRPLVLNKDSINNIEYL